MPGRAEGRGCRGAAERWAGAHEGRGGAGRQQQPPSGGHVSAGWAGLEYSGGEAVEWGRLEQPAFEGGLREGAAGSDGSVGCGVAMGWKVGQAEVVVGPAAVVEGAVEGREVEAGQRSYGSTGRVRPATWTDLRRAGMGGCDEGDVGEGGDGTKMLKRRKPKPDWGVSERGPFHACCQIGNPGKMRSLKGDEVEACIPLEEVVAALSGGAVGC